MFFLMGFGAVVDQVRFVVSEEGRKPPPQKTGICSRRRHSILVLECFDFGLGGGGGVLCLYLSVSYSRRAGGIVIRLLATLALARQSPFVAAPLAC